MLDLQIGVIVARKYRVGVYTENSVLDATQMLFSPVTLMQQ